MKEFLLASANQHKAEELGQLLSSVGIKIKASAKKLEVAEEADNFMENALAKANAYYEEFKRPSLADDSGLVLSHHPEILGVHSARFAPEFSDYQDKNKKLLELMSSDHGEQRSAYFVCVLCFYLSPEEIYFFEGRLNGSIAIKACGEGGFGYDPVFLPEGEHGGKSLAQMPEWKMQHSHRACACQQAVNFFQGHE